MKVFHRFLYLAAVIILAQSIYAQPQFGGGNKATKADKSFSFMPIPYINSDKTIWFSGSLIPSAKIWFAEGIFPLATYNLYHKDTISPASVSGGFGMYTSNKSWFVMQFNKLYFNQDKYRATTAIGTGYFNAQFYLDLPIFSDFIDYSTAVTFAKFELQRRIFTDFYFGLYYIYGKIRNDFNLEDIETNNIYLNGLGSVLSYDLRDDVYYPLHGYFVNVNYTTYPEWMDNEFVSSKIVLDYNHYFGMKNKRDVLATRLYAGMGIGDLNFNQQFTIGNNDIRGYTQGKYRGEQLIAIQSEYRWNPFNKLGFVGFAGLATVLTAFNEEDNGKILPGIGAGFRYTVFPDKHMNVGMDFAAGQDDWGIYFKIGEAF